MEVYKRIYLFLLLYLFQECVPESCCLSLCCSYNSVFCFVNFYTKRESRSRECNKKLPHISVRPKNVLMRFSLKFSKPNWMRFNRFHIFNLDVFREIFSTERYNYSIFLYNCIMLEVKNLGGQQNSYKIMCRLHQHQIDWRYMFRYSWHNR